MSSRKRQMGQKLMLIKSSLHVQPKHSDFEVQFIFILQFLRRVTLKFSVSHSLKMSSRKRQMGQKLMLIRSSFNIQPKQSDFEVQYIYMNSYRQCARDDFAVAVADGRRKCERILTQLKVFSLRFRSFSSLRC